MRRRGRNQALGGGRGDLNSAEREMQDRRRRMAETREAIEQWKAIAEGADTRFWGAIKRVVAVDGGVSRARIQNHERMTDVERALWLDRFLRYEWFIEIVEKAPLRIATLEEKYAKLKAGGSQREGLV